MDDEATTPFGTGERSQLGGSVSGGSELLRYFVSGEAERELGITKMPAREVEYLRAERGTPDVPFEQRRPNEQKKNSGRLNVSASAPQPAEPQPDRKRDHQERHPAAAAGRQLPEHDHVAP